MGIILAGDVGGTKTLLCLAEPQAEGNPKVLFEARYPSASYEHLSLMVRVFLHQAQEELGYEPQPSKACFGIAGPVIDGTSELTNLGWLLESQHLSEELNIEGVKLINDFAAIGYGVLGMQKSDLCTLQEGKAIAKAPIAILGAGTGLGQAFLTWHGNSYEVYASEGGHADFAPQTEIEIGLLKYLVSRYSRVSVERVVSGKGIVDIYRYLRDSEFAQESEQICDLVHNCDLGKSDQDPAATISAAALAKEDVISEQTMLLFTKLYASEAGNMALRLLPYGGLYIAGGIAPKILPLLQQPQFLAAIKRKGRVSYLLDNIPIHIVTHAGIGLIGAMLYADRL
ncbi:glucokinase [Tumidithrix helvetica PCC 7403]|uniref:glucokinase n=1 Tax=Tumidithrix helvetica TaxID=3457545 RepID=UPI003CBA4CE8